MTDVFLSGRPGQSTNQPGPPQLPAIPSYDGTPGSLQGTIDALVTATRAMAGQNVAANNKGNTSQQSGNTAKSTTNSKKKDGGGRFTEVSRVTKTVKISNPDDDTQYVMVEQITKLIMQDNVTKEQWVWSR